MLMSEILLIHKKLENKAGFNFFLKNYKNLMLV